MIKYKINLYFLIKLLSLYQFIIYLCTQIVNT